MNANEDEQEAKAQAIQEALKDFVVYYGVHDGGLTPNMARVNGYSIVWHEYAHCAGEPNTVEVMLPNGDVEGHLPISKLRELVT